MTDDPDDDLGADAFDGADDFQGDPDGFCHLAGSEWCELECPERARREDVNMLILRAAREDKRQAELPL